MDMSFFRRARRALDKSEPTPFDHDRLVAELAAQKADGAEPSAETAAEDPLTELLTGAPGWREAVARQGGCFSRAAAGRRGKGR
ncbi:MAG: hypothetical protein ACT4OE_06910 [Sphingosinicella sp.]